MIARLSMRLFCALEHIMDVLQHTSADINVINLLKRREDGDLYIMYFAEETHFFSHYWCTLSGT